MNYIQVIDINGFETFIVIQWVYCPIVIYSVIFCDGNITVINSRPVGPAIETPTQPEQLLQQTLPEPPARTGTCVCIVVVLFVLMSKCTGRPLSFGMETLS